MRLYSTARFGLQTLDMRGRSTHAQPNPGFFAVRCIVKVYTSVMMSGLAVVRLRAQSSNPVVTVCTPAQFSLDDVLHLRGD